MVYETLEQIVEDLDKNPVEKGGNIYHPIPFPEFDHLKTSSNKDEVLRKWEIIKGISEKISNHHLEKLRVLDVGANAGFYTFSFAKEGSVVTAFELHPRYAPIGKFLAQEKNINVNWYDLGFEEKLVESKKFDIALVLSVFQWMADGGNTLAIALKQLHTISKISNYMIFELGFNAGKSCIRTAKFNHYAELIGLLKHNTAYNCFKLLGKTNLWGSGTRYLLLCSNDQSQDDNLLGKFLRSIRI